MGVNVSRVYTCAFTLGIFLAALGGAFTAPKISVQPGVWHRRHRRLVRGRRHRRPRQHAGRGDRRAYRRLARAPRPPPRAGGELFIVYIVMAVVLAFRPEGLFQRTQARKI